MTSTRPGGTPPSPSPSGASAGLDGSARQRGVILVAAAAICWSSGGAIARMIEADPWTTVFWRALFSASALLLFMLWRDRGRTFALFREMGFEGRGLPRLAYLVGAGLIALVLAGLAIWFSDDRRIAAIFVGSTVLAFLVLRAVAWGVQWLARRSPRVSSTALRLAMTTTSPGGVALAAGGMQASGESPAAH